MHRPASQSSHRRRRPVRRESGATLAISALVITTLVLAVSFTIDLGRQMNERRDLQTQADVIALDLSRLADGRTRDQILTDTVEVDAGAGDGSTVQVVEYDNVLAQSLDANGVLDSELVGDPVWGRWTCEDGTEIGSVDTDGDGKFDVCENAVFTPLTAGTEIPSAVQVTLTRDVEYMFQPGGGSATRSAIAYLPEWANVSLGTKFAEANPCVFEDDLANNPCQLDTPAKEELDTVLSLFSGVDVSIDAVSYAGLVSAEVTLGDLAVAAGAGSVDEFLSTELTMAEVITIAATALTNDGDAVRADYFAQLAAIEEERQDTIFHEPTPEIPNPPVEDPILPADLYDFATPGSGAASAGAVNLFDFVLASYELSNGENFLTTCAGTVDSSEIEAGHDGIDDPPGGVNAVVPPVDVGPLAVISDELCIDVVEARQQRMGPVGALQDITTAQATISHTTLIRWGDPNTNVPLASSEPCDLIADNGVLDCEALPFEPEPCDAVAGGSLEDCIAPPGAPCDLEPSALDPNDGIPECPVPVPGPCNNVPGDGIEDCVAAAGLSCDVLSLFDDDGNPDCSLDPQQPDPCDLIAGNGTADCTAAEGDPCDTIPDGTVPGDDGVPDCPPSVPEPCNNISGDNVQDCVAAADAPCDSEPDPTDPPDDGEPECPDPDAPNPCDDVAANDIPDCVQGSAAGLLPSLPDFGLGGIPIPISGEFRLPLTVEIAQAVADVTTVNVDNSTHPPIECRDEENEHFVGVFIETQPATATLGSGTDTPIGSITVTDPLTGVEYGMDVFLEYSPVSSTASSHQGVVGVGETFHAEGSDPVLSLDPTEANIRLEPTTPAVLPEGDLLGSALGTVVDPITGAVTTLNQQAVRAIVFLGVDAVLDELIVMAEQQASRVEFVQTFADGQVKRVDSIPTLVVGRLLSVLDQAGLGVGTVDFTNVGIGQPVKDEDGTVVDFDIQCGLPTLVE